MSEKLNLATALISTEVFSGEIGRGDGMEILSSIHQSSETSILEKAPATGKWPTAEELSRIAATQPDPRDVVREMRKKVRPASAKTLGMRLD